jgi:hypothetical protein
LLYTRGIPRARAWDLPNAPDPRTVNIPRYRRLLTRAVDTILESVIGMDKMQNQLAFDFVPL